MTGFKRTTAATLTAILLTIAACSALPGGGGGNDPVSAANAALAAAESGGFGKLTEFACAAQKDSIASAFGSGDMSQLTSMGIDPNELFNSMKIDFQDMTVTPVSASGSDATVHMKGKVGITVDPAAARNLVKKILGPEHHGDRRDGRCSAQPDVRAVLPDQRHRRGREDGPGGRQVAHLQLGG